MTINQTPITPASLIVFTLIVLAAIFATRFFTRLVFDRILNKFHLKDGVRYTLRRLTEYTLHLVGIIVVGVSYGSDLDLVLKSLKDVALENPKVLKDPEPDVLLREFGESSWNMRLRLWIDNPTEHHQIRSDINCAIVRKFRENGVEIPFPQRDLHVRSPLPLPLTKEN